MRSIAATILLGCLIAAPLVAQDDPAVSRLRAVLPADLATAVTTIVQQARANGLPTTLLIDRALEGAAKRADPAQILAGVSQTRIALGAAREFVAAGGREPIAADVSAAATALQIGVSGEAISDLARATPSGQTLSVPLGVMAELLAGGVPAGEALEQVRMRLAGLPFPSSPGGAPAWAGPPSSGGSAGPPAGGRPHGPGRPTPPVPTGRP